MHRLVAIIAVWYAIAAGCSHAPGQVFYHQPSCAVGGRFCPRVQPAAPQQQYWQPTGPPAATAPPENVAPPPYNSRQPTPQTQLAPVPPQPPRELIDCQQQKAALAAELSRLQLDRDRLFQQREEYRRSCDVLQGQVLHAQAQLHAQQRPGEAPATSPGLSLDAIVTSIGAKGLIAIGVSPTIASIAFAAGWWLVKRRGRTQVARQKPPADVDTTHQLEIDRLRAALANAIRDSAAAKLAASIAAKTERPDLAPELQAARLEIQRLQEALAGATQTVTYASPPMVDDLPRMREAMRLVSDHQPAGRVWVKMFEEAFKLIKAGEVPHHGQLS